MKFHLERIAMSLINGISNNIRVFEKLASKQDSDKANTPPLQATESSKVTLSEDAKALANFTNKGIAVSMKEFDTPLTKANAAGRGRLRKRKIKHAKRAWRLAPSGTASEWTRRGSWPRPWAAPRWPAASWPTRSCCRSSSACGRLCGRAAWRLPARRGGARRSARAPFRQGSP